MPLKGITSSNDDPDACACCSAPLVLNVERKNNGKVTLCCGKHICHDCTDSGRDFIGSGATKRCSFCNTHCSRKETIGSTKKHAKKGAAWGQYSLGVSYHKGALISQSDYDAKRWFEKAAKQGHPGAILGLGHFHLEGLGGCSVDLAKAREYAEKAKSLYPRLADECHIVLYHIAKRVDSTEAKSILLPLAKEGHAHAQDSLGAIMFDEQNNLLDAKAWFEAASLQGQKNSVFNSLITCKQLKIFPETNFWFNIISKNEMMPAELDSRTSVENIGCMLRKLRDNCGGCGADLEGGRRNYCRQCKTFCYCSRDCQKLHWNRIDEGGHRDECMGVKLLEDKMAAAQQLFSRTGPANTGPATSCSSSPSPTTSHVENDETVEKIFMLARLVEKKRVIVENLYKSGHISEAKQGLQGIMLHSIEMARLEKEAGMTLAEVKELLGLHPKRWQLREEAKQREMNTSSHAK